MQNIKNVILDYGNVIFMIDFERSKKAFQQLGVENVDNVFAHHGQIALFDDFDKGMITSAEFREGIRQLAEKPELTDDEVDSAWNALLVGVPPGKYEVVQQLHERYRTFLLSNNNEIHYAECMAHIRDEYGIPDNSPYFEKTYYSHQIGMRKPEPEIFRFVLEDSGLVAEETLFIDDSPQHLKTAKELGFQTALCSAERPLERIVREMDL